MRRKSGTDNSGSALPHPTPIPDEAMEVIADVLIACAGSDSRHPAYSEEQLGRKQRRAAHAEEYFCTASTDGNSSLSYEDDFGVISASLTADDKTVWEMYTAGYRISEIARLLSVPRQNVIRRLRIVRRHIHTSQSPFRGLGEVYRHEVHKCTYRRPSHCVDQPCRRLGYCKFPPSQARLPFRD